MWTGDLGGVDDSSRSDDVGIEAVSVVPTPSRGIFFSRLIAAVTSESDDFEGALADGLSRYDDRAWSWYITRPFTWQQFTNWWVSRRWVRPRDIRKG
jgi:hypothetical protein